VALEDLDHDLAFTGLHQAQIDAGQTAFRLDAIDQDAVDPLGGVAVNAE
jgi:hypothetical protein